MILLFGFLRLLLCFLVFLTAKIGRNTIEKVRERTENIIFLPEQLCDDISISEI